MIVVETYIKYNNSFVRVNSETNVEVVTDPFYMEGAILIKNYNQIILGFEHWDLVDHLWSYLVDAIEQLLYGKNQTSFLFPDQPLKLSFCIEKRNVSRLLLIVGKEKYVVDKKEFILELFSAANIFYEFAVKVDASALVKKERVQELEKYFTFDKQLK